MRPIRLAGNQRQRELLDEVARLTGLCRDLLDDQMRRGNLHYLKIGGRRLAPAVDVDAVLAGATALSPGYG